MLPHRLGSGARRLERLERDEWLVYRPLDVTLPKQGWKIHVSGRPDNAEDILRIVWDHCLTHRVTFKFLRNSTVLLARSSKYAERSGSGKLVAVYPVEDDQLGRILDELGRALDGMAGPYILSDLRWDNGPLHVRYGGFVERLCTGDGGELVPAIEAPDGTLVPDLRKPVFSTPDWVALPPFLRPHLDARTAGSGTALPYRVQRALHFSNGGGVYLASRKADGLTAVLKEARPHAGLDRYGIDAVARLRGERDTLSRLAGVPGVPRLYEHFACWEHEFLAIEFVDGMPLSRWTAREDPLVRHEVAPGHIADYTRRALRILDSVEAVVAAIHERGMVFCDLHPNNVMVREDGSVCLVDFELAADADAEPRAGLAAPGFAAPADRTGPAVDSYALAALRLFLFLPLNVVLALDPGKVHDYVALIERRFPLPDGYGAAILRELAPAGTAAGAEERRPSPACIPGTPQTDWSAVRGSLVAAILRSATPHRADRLFPGGVEQFAVGGYGLAHGAAGVLHALSVAGAGRVPDLERWLIDRVAAGPPRRAGAYDGALGVAWVLERLGHTEAAGGQLARVVDALPRVRDISLSGGLAGVGLGLLSFADSRARPELVDEAAAIGRRLAAALDDAADSPTRGPARAGLILGWSGAAVLFGRLAERTGQARWRELAERAVRRDLADCVATPDGTLQVADRGRRSLPYLEVGSAGILYAARIGLDERQQAGLGAELAGLRAACLPELVSHPNLFGGRAGLLVALAAERRVDGAEEVTAAIHTHMDALGLHALSYQGELAVPGNQLLRLSMDMATGNAGILLGVAAVDGHQGVLPLLGATPGSAPVPAKEAMHSTPLGTPRAPSG